MKYRSCVARYLCLIIFVVAPELMAGQDAATPNPNCTLIVPSNPLTAEGLATPYQLVATDPTAGDCHETNPDLSAFVPAAVMDPATDNGYPDTIAKIGNTTMCVGQQRLIPSKSI